MPKLIAVDEVVAAKTHPDRLLSKAAEVAAARAEADSHAIDASRKFCDDAAAIAQKQAEVAAEAARTAAAAAQVDAKTYACAGAKAKARRKKKAAKAKADEE